MPQQFLSNVSFRKSTLLLFLFPVFAFSYSSPGSPQGFVNDFASILNAQDELALETKLLSLQSSTGIEIAIVTIKTLGGDTVENYAVKLFEEWHIGKAEKDNGALLLIARDEKEMRIEVGYGLEPLLTDSQSGQIIRNIIIPAFQNGDYGEGISTATNAMIAAVTEDESAYASATSPKNSFRIEDVLFWSFFVFVWTASILGRSKSWWAGGAVGAVIGVIVGFIKGFLWLGFGAIVLFVPLGLLFDFFVSRGYSRAKTTGHYPWWIGGPGGFGGGGGFGGFGGGRSGGGGASGRW